MPTLLTYYEKSTPKNRLFLTLAALLLLVAFVASMIGYLTAPSWVSALQIGLLALTAVLFFVFYASSSKALFEDLVALKTERERFDEKLQHAVKERTQELEKTNELLLKDLNIDSVTNIMNKRAFLQKLRDAILRFNQDNVPFSIIQFDVDHFQHVNHKYGRKIGNEILAKIAKMTAQNCRLVDVVARIAGDEFVILMHNTTFEDALELAELLRKKIEWAVFLDDHHVTASFGVVEINTKQDEFTILHHTDLAVQRAKHSGRNRISRLEKEDLVVPQ